LLLFVGKIDIWSSLGFLFIYAFYVLVVVITNNKNKSSEVYPKLKSNDFDEALQ
jgi:Ca2+/Na+ antiporter